MKGLRKILALPARALAVVAVLAAVLAVTYAVWLAARYAWTMGLHFYESRTITAAAVRDGFHCFVLAVALLLWPRLAGAGRPEIRKGGWAYYAYGALAAAAALAVFANHIRPFFTSPFAGRGPLFFTLGPLAWELTWPGFAFGLASAAAGPRASPAVPYLLVILLTVAGAAWYVPVFLGMRPLDKIGFVAVTLAVNFLSLTLRRRTGSIWPGLAGHVLVKFFLTW